MTPDMLRSQALWGFQKQTSLQIPQSISVLGGSKAGVCVRACISREQIFTAASSQDQRKHSSQMETILRDFKPTHEKSLSC